MNIKRIGEVVFQVVVVASQVACVVIAIHDHKSVFLAFLPTISMVLLSGVKWLTDRWGMVIRVYKRLYALPDIFRADLFILICKPNDIQKNLTIRTNYKDNKDVVALLAYTSIEINNPETLIDGITNELGIKRADD